MKKQYYVCDGCEAEIPDKKPDHCPLCGRKDFTVIEKDINKDLEDEKYTKKYDEVIKQLEEYSKDVPPEKSEYSFED